jgi:dihydrofolate synthase/folylpolyglutamate synthase
LARSLTQWVEYIQTLHPRSIDLSLERVAKVWDKFKPVEMPPLLAIAGTNGKGSSVSMLESVYRYAGYRTGTFTSPHLVRFNERISLNNIPVSDEILLNSFERIEKLRGDNSLTFFEFNTLLALDIFCATKLDVILLEVGMGGRLDAVNIVDNDLALITAIAIDHSAWLGTDREQIGVEKAGIIEPGGLVVLADPDVPRSIVNIAISKKAEFVQAGHDYHIRPTPGVGHLFASDHRRLSAFNGFELAPSLKHVLNNTAGVIAALALMAQKLPISEAQLIAGLAKQSLIGRLQLIEGKPLILLDVSHNEASVLSMIEYIDSLQIRGRIHAVFGALADKDYGSAYDGLKKRVAAWYLSTLKGDRGQTARALGERLFRGKSELMGRSSVNLFDSPEKAFVDVKSKAGPRDLIVIFGSFHLVGAIIPHLNS